ncbi:MAG TPA: hypothetical protein VHG10_09310, partial [Glycomyces sp.]|nr:hypothetical protein [Glycomyces sp.]
WELVWQRLRHPEGTGLAQMPQYGEPLPSRNRPWLDRPTLLVDDAVLGLRVGLDLPAFDERVEAAHEWIVPEMSS